MTEQIAQTNAQQAGQPEQFPAPSSGGIRKRIQNIGVAVVVLVVLVAAYVYIGDRKFDWNPSYSRSSDQPMDYYLMIEALKQMYGSSRVSFFSGTLEQLKEKMAEPVLIIYVNDIWEPDAEESEAFWNMLLERGSSALIAVNNTSDFFTHGQPSSFRELDVSYFNYIDQYISKPDVLSFLEANLNGSTEKYRFLRGFNNHYLARASVEKVSTLHWKVEVLGSLTSDNTSISRTPNPYSTDPNRTEWLNFVKFTSVKHPETEVYVHVNPLYISNYAFTTHACVGYAEQLLGKLPDLPVIWVDMLVGSNSPGPDRPNRNNRQLLSFILSSEALTWGLYIVIGLFAMYVLSNVRRKQKAIPIVVPPANSAAGYARTLGLLMEETATTDVVGQKMAHAFLAHIRKKYRLSTDVLDDDFCQRLAFKSGKELQEVQRFIQQTRSLAVGRTGISENDLIKYQKGLLTFR